MRSRRTTASGHDVVLRAYPGFRALGSTRDVLGLYGAAQYTWAVRDGLFRVLVQSDDRASIHARTMRISDAALQPAAHLVSPTIAGLGRIVLDGAFLYRWRNFLNQINYLGGDDRLRGYPTNFFVGANVLAYNVEARNASGGDPVVPARGRRLLRRGDAYTSSAQFHPYQSVGVGLRGLFPWLDRTVFRVDFGFPLQRPIDPTTGAPIPPFAFLLSFTRRSRRRRLRRRRSCRPGKGPIRHDRFDDFVQGIRALAPRVRAAGRHRVLIPDCEERCRQRVCEGAWVARRYQDAGAVVGEDVGNTAHTCGDDRSTARERFEDDVRSTFRPAGQGEDVTRSHPFGDVGMGSWAEHSRGVRSPPRSAGAHLLACIAVACQDQKRAWDSRPDALECIEELVNPFCGSRRPAKRTTRASSSTPSFRRMAARARG